jgi:phosphohistidine phosphatase SixA
VASRAEHPSRRELALAIPFLPFLGLGRSVQALQEGKDPAGTAGYASAILLRHAEKEAPADPKAPADADPALSRAGKERAGALGRLLARAGATHLFASEYRRTRETLVPLAEARSLEIEILPAAELKRLVNRLRTLPAGSVSVVAGHSNTIPVVAQALGCRIEDVVSTQNGPTLRDDEYGRLFVVTFEAAREGNGTPQGSLVELAYGA